MDYVVGLIYVGNGDVVGVVFVVGDGYVFGVFGEG